jgi:hypothetical protein
MCVFLVTNKTSYNYEFFKKYAFYKVSTGYTDDGCYENQNANIIIIIIINKGDEGLILVILNTIDTHKNELKIYAAS